MTAASARRPSSPSPAKMASPAAADLIGMFVQRNPKSNRDDVTEVVKLVAEFSATAARLSPTARKRLLARKAEIKKVIAEIAAEPGAKSPPVTLVSKSPAGVSQGAGLGEIVSLGEGRARLAAYATPAKLEDWAGPVVGATELERDFGIPRSTLHNWQKQGAVIGLLAGLRKHAFPTEQFVDGRPIAGLGDVVSAVGDPRTAWLWLREPNPALGGAAPLARLQAGGVARVIEVARANFAG